MFRIIASFLVFISIAYAEPRLYGLDVLGGARYGNVISASYPDGFALGIFTQRDLFGDAYPVVDDVLGKKHIPLVRYNLRWSDTHSFSRSDFPKILAEAKRFVPLVDKYPAVECQFSGATEHQLRQADAQILANLILATIPERCVYVNNPWVGRGSFLAPQPRVVNEVHGSGRPPPGAYNFSFDGTSAVNSNVEATKAAFSNAEVFFFHGPRLNGLWGGSPGVPRAQRKGWPDARYLQSLAALAEPKGVTKLPKKWLFKSHSENKGNNDPRAEKPVWVVPPKTKQVELRTDSGQVVDTAKYYGGFPDGRSRYYARDWGYAIADRARRIQGSPLCHVFVNGKEYGVINPAFRDGDFR